MPRIPKPTSPSSNKSKGHAKPHSRFLLLLVAITVLAITRIFPTLRDTSSFLGNVDARFLPSQHKKTHNQAISPLPKDNDNDKIPGPVMNDRLHILGIRLTTSYEKSDESVFVDLLGHGVGEGSNVLFHVVNMDAPNQQLTYKEATKQILFAKVHNSVDNEGINARIRMEYIPNKSIDGNTVGVHLIWRANISALVSKSNLLSRSHLRVSIYTNPENPHYPEDTPILTVDIPMDTASLGHAGPVVKQTNQSFLQQAQAGPPVGVILCVAGVDAGAIWYLPEFIQHHLNVGVQQIFLGVEGGENDYAMLQEKLAYFIEELGVVVLGGESMVMNNRQVRKLRFYNQCLFHAKGMAKYVVNWDVDELWMPPPLTTISNNVQTGPGPSSMEQHKDDRVWMNSPYSKSVSLVEAIQMIRGENGCTDWCYQTIPSYTIHRIDKEQGGATQPRYQGYYGFSRREKDPNYTWQKPIIRTEYAFQSSFHLGGSCLIPSTSTSTTQQLEPEVYHTYSRMNKDCPIYKQNVTLGSMHHYYWLFRPEWGVEKAEKFPDLDEYTQHLRGATVAQLVQLQKENKVNITGAKYTGHGSKVDTA